MELGLSGLASGFDWRSLIEQLNEVERAPQRRLRSEQSTLDLRKNAYASNATQLGILKKIYLSRQRVQRFATDSLVPSLFQSIYPGFIVRFLTAALTGLRQ